MKVFPIYYGLDAGFEYDIVFLCVLLSFVFLSCVSKINYCCAVRNQIDPFHVRPFVPGVIAIIVALRIRAQLLHFPSA